MSSKEIIVMSMFLGFLVGGSVALASNLILGFAAFAFSTVVFALLSIISNELEKIAKAIKKN